MSLPRGIYGVWADSRGHPTGEMSKVARATAKWRSLTRLLGLPQLVREATLIEADLAEVARCRRDHNRLGLAYQIGFVRLFNRFPAQQPLEICDELLNFVALQLNIDAANIEAYAVRQHTVSDHQAGVRDYLKLTVFDPE